ncbi:MAG: hypothetical protein H0W84_11465 [Bacteroidetes bacterium]|nr:hypothetical protein [Bacteroidota bacterium]
MENQAPEKKDGLLKYFLAGLVVAVIIFSVIILIKKDDNIPELKKSHIWPAETDSLFVKNCYNKYKPQIKDDMTKQEVTKIFCRCMLEKVKMQYEDKDIDYVRNDEIIVWDGECRAELSNPGFLK